MVPEQWCMTEGLSTWVSDTTTCRLWFAFLESEWYLCTPSGLPLSKWSMGSLQIISATMHNSCYSILFLVMHIYIYICSYMYIHVYPILRPISVPGPVSNCRCGVRRSDQVSTLRSCLRAAMVKDIIPTLHVRIRGAVEIRMFIICSLYPLVI